MSDICKENFDQICRLCSSSLSTKHQIFGESGLFTTIDECLQIKTHKEDGLPPHVCDSCLASLQNLKAFRTTCHDTQAKLIACLGGINGDDTEIEETRTKPLQVKIEPKEEAVDTEPDPQSTVSSDNDNDEGTLEDIKENGLERFPELGEPNREDYVLMKEETFSLDASRENRNGPGGILAEHLVEFNNNNNNSSMANNNTSGSSSSSSPSEKDRDLVDGQRLRKEVLAPMWDVFEKSWPRKEATNGEKTMIRVVHRRYVVNKHAFPCSLCGECFKFDQGYERGGTPESRPYNCNACGKVFPKRSSWKLHQVTHEEVKPYQCRVCSKGFNRKEHLSKHLLSHGTVRPYSCEKCGKVFARKEHLTRHMIATPSCELSRPYSCQTCGQSFVRKEHLTRHMKRVHNIEPEVESEQRRFACEICSRAFTRREHLRRHQLVHQKENPALFMEVQASLEEPSSFEGSNISDLQLNSEDNPTPSPPQSPEERRNNADPESIKKPTIVTCHICLKGFSRRSHLSRHLKQVHKTVPEGTNEIHRCDECGKDFGRRYHLERHAKIHQNKQYECVTCGETFTESEALDKHMTVHGNTVLQDFLWM